MSKQKNFKNSKAYKIIIIILFLLYIGFRIWGAQSNESTYQADTEQVDTQQDATNAVANTTEFSSDNDEQTTEYTQESMLPEETDSSAEDASSQQPPVSEEASAEILYSFRSNKLWESHYEKHGIEMGFEDKEAYLEAANAVIANEDTLHKIEAEDGDDVYYLEATNEFVVVSTDGYLRTYFCPNDGIDYFNRQ